VNLSKDTEYCEIDLSGKVVCHDSKSKKVKSTHQPSEVNYDSYDSLHPFKELLESFPFSAEKTMLALVYSENCPHCHELMKKIKPLINNRIIIPVSLEKNQKIAFKLLKSVHSNYVPTIILTAKRPKNKGYYFCLVTRNAELKKCYLYKEEK